MFLSYLAILILFLVQLSFSSSDIALKLGMFGDSEQKVLGVPEEKAPHAVISKLEITLTPQYDHGEATSLGVELRFVPDYNPTESNGLPVLLQAPKTISGTPVLSIKPGSLEVTDDDGILELVTEIDSPAPNVVIEYYRPLRRPIGSVRVIYSALSRQVDKSTRGGPSFDMRMEENGLLTSGYGLLALPASENGEIYDIQLIWDLSSSPNGTKAVWTFGYSPSIATRRLRLDELWGTFFMVGPLHSYRDDTIPPRTGEKNFNMYWLRDPPFDANEMAARISKTFQAMSDFFNDNEDTYRVFLRYNPYHTSTEGSGTAVIRSFTFCYNLDNQKAPVPIDAMVEVLTHEMVHNWVILKGADGSDNWFSEGLAEYYSLVFLYRLGIIDDARVIAAFNSRLSAYYTSPLVNTSVVDAFKKVWAMPTAQRLPYRRGITFAIKVNEVIKQATDSKLSLDNLVLDLLRQQMAGGSVGIADYVAWLGNYIGSEAAQELVQGMSMGTQLIVPSPSSFPLTLTRPVRMIREDQFMYDLGFDETSAFAEGYVVRDLRDDSRAAKAGLRELDHFSRSLSMPDTKYNESIKAAVVRGVGSTFNVEFWPRGSTLVESWKYVLD
ncbi:hypothetical protein NQ176_g2721 [Zarea fungicola]|uniref:Uncharacterized protein n=1 Tax=Zarea fungicola TaxID=93591 RepID=A0ACC1NN23_9HYPO|nr:hypothetical protein NQ176_g2721 [Lecanicillium fungicola]